MVLAIPPSSTRSFDSLRQKGSDLTCSMVVSTASSVSHSPRMAKLGGGGGGEERENEREREQKMGFMFPVSYHNRLFCGLIDKQ